MGTNNSEDVGELPNALNVLSEVDTNLAYSSEKLANLENLLLHVLAGENDIGTIGVENDTISAESIEKAFTIDLLFAILNFELIELDSFMGDVQDLIVDALHKIASCELSEDLVNGPVTKLRDSEELLKQSQDRILEMKIQLAKLQMTSFYIKQNECESCSIFTSTCVFRRLGKERKPKIQTIEQRNTLRMLEKSLAREMELEKKLTELKQNEEDLKLKTGLVEQVAFCMEEAAEVTLSRFLEADNRAEVLMGISKEMLGKLQILQFNSIGSTKREEETKSKLQDCLHNLNAKEASIEKLKSSIAHLMVDNAEVTVLREKVRMQEKKLVETESRLKEVSTTNETSQTQLKEMESEIEALRENIYAAENRAEKAEEKVTHLTESNLELTEELEFLKGSNDNNSKKASLLEKELRDLDIQMQHSKALSEAGQEQQNMLYSAIWDMETLIDELKQNVAKAESKTESAEERCIILSETNSEINKELDFVRSRMENLEASLNQARVEKKSSAKDISISTKLIMDTVMQLAMERERIEKQLIYLTNENIFLKKKVRKEQKDGSIILQDKRSCDDKENIVDAESARACDEATEISSESFQACFRFIIL
ncbi:hypothetical protein RD792_011243 [Penstemon davidsonii]|uniref:WIT1/2 N-terminal helical bundle domain-containing protein n=1 Tax=Penstemon davidsonii TaxID=160366 RepID=A0ABR0D432_9LAMI|nr:hypothetical protein RD792_011243 [Penstemon davidsonii]